MLFFTDITTSASQFCLLNINKYEDPRKATKKLRFIDPGVNELKKSKEYQNIDLLHFLAENHLASTEFISIDYPGDMNLQYSDLFLQKSIQNNWKYADNFHYICTVQYLWRDYIDFEFRMKELQPIYAHKKKIVGLGNMCRLLVKKEKMNRNSDEYIYLDKVFHYLIDHGKEFYWIHIYGMSLYAIKEFIPMLQNTHPNLILSVDSTKWTRACTDDLKKQYGLNCNSKTRDLFFKTYIHEIQHAGIIVKY
jgi:hypothetical protein